MSLQRRRGLTATIFKLAEVTDHRGNKTLAPDRLNPLKVKAWAIPQRSSKAEVPGQQVINILRLGVPADTPDVQVWNIVVWNGLEYDIVAPPAYRHGTRQVRHFSVDLRERPHQGA